MISANNKDAEHSPSTFSIGAIFSGQNLSPLQMNCFSWTLRMVKPEQSAVDGLSVNLIWIICRVTLCVYSSLVDFFLLFLCLIQMIQAMCMWAATWQTQENGCAPSEDSNQPGHPPSLIRVFACAQWVAKDPSFLHADSEDSDQTGRVPRLIWVFAGRTLIFLVLSCRGSCSLIAYSFESQVIPLPAYAKCIELR